MDVAGGVDLDGKLGDKISDMDDIKAKDQLMLSEKPAVMEVLKQVQGGDIDEYCDIEIGLL